jgi:hypothetical protein
MPLSFVLLLGSDNMDEMLKPRCGCQDCEAAVSPGAYLASLLDYAVKHVRNNGAKIDLAFLEARFNQPFAALPVDCGAKDELVRRVRLAVEVLREYVGHRPLFPVAREKALHDAEADYRLEAYTHLLTLLGTNYEEVRRARSADAGDRTELALRLGIDLTPDPSVPRQDELDRLFLLDATLTEHNLERLFGLGDTGRDRLSEGAKDGDGQQQLVRWNFDGAYWNYNTDAEGLIYLSIFFKPADGVYAVSAYRDEGRTEIVASGEGKATSGPIRLVPENGSGLSGVVDINYKADDTGTSLSLVPLVLGWRLRHLRTLWEREDWPTADAQLPPLIDPQVISASDLRSVRPSDPGEEETAFDLWLGRFNWLNQRRSELELARGAAVSDLAALETMIAQALSTPDNSVTAANLTDLAEAQERGERIEQELQQLGLTPGAFAFLKRVLDLAGEGQPIIEAEWEIVYDTLLGARKQHEFATWRAFERGLKLTLSPTYFRIGDEASAPEQATSLSVPLWLSTREARRTWVEVLEARIAQEAAIAAGLENAVSSAEEATLPQLRDALLVASDAEGSSPPDRAEWLTQRLLIDFRMSGAQLTTRVAQAYETLQELLFSLRTGQLEQDTLSPSAPLVSISAAARGDGRIDLIGRGEDNVLWHRVWDGRWRSWRSRGPLPGAGSSFGPSDPAVVARGDGRLDLVVRGGDRFLWYRRYDQAWLDWQRVEGNLELVNNPAVALRGPDQLDVVALRSGDGQVMRSRYDGTAWSAWEAVGANSSRSPAAVSWAPDRLDLFLGLPAPTLFKPSHRWWDGTAWQDESLDGVFASDPAAASQGVNRLDVFQNRFGHLWQMSWNGTWGPWTDLDAALAANDPQLKGVPSVYSQIPGTLDVFAIRIGRIWRRRFEANAWSDWEMLPSDHLELEAPDFDEEWEWLGSYATWRSAMFVYLYPDNLLLPSLVTHQTPAFTKLIDGTRPTKRLTPEQACAWAREYSDYLKDVSSLKIGATCQVSTIVDKNNDPCKKADGVSKDLLHMFGLTTWGKVYWSAIDPEDRSGYAQSFWDELPLESEDGKAAALLLGNSSGEKAPVPKVVEIIGALPWRNTYMGQHHIYLFVKVDERGEWKLKCIRFDVDKYPLERGELIELELSGLPKYGIPDAKDPNIIHYIEPTVKDLKILPVQSNSVREPPRLAIHTHLPTNSVYIRPLNAEGSGWDDSAGDWEKNPDPSAFQPGYKIEPQYTRPQPYGGVEADTVYVLEAALRVNEVNWLVYKHKHETSASRVAYASVTGQSGADICMYPSYFRGALPGYSADSSIFIFYDDAGQTVYREISKSGGGGSGATWPALGTAFIPTPTLETLAPHSGSWAPTYFVTSSTGDYSNAYRCQALNGELVGSTKLQVVPKLNPVYNQIPAGASVNVMQQRRANIRKDYEQGNKGASASILTYLAEAYRLVPLQLALNMQASGQYAAALDWFMAVYDYRAEQGERYIDYGLEIDAGHPATGIFRHAEDWLLDPLNPHAVALTRRYAYTRFTIAAIIRCLNDFADAEFTQDTGESLVRARVLYTTALELGNVPGMRQDLDSCDALIAELKIQPGEMVPPEVAAALGEIAEELTISGVGNAPDGIAGLEITLETMKGLVQSGMSSMALDNIIPELNELKKDALKGVPVPSTAGTVLMEPSVVTAEAYRSLLTDPGIEKVIKLSSEVAVSEAYDRIGGESS